MGLKVSVVVPVYNPGKHIDALIDSLRRQSLPAEEFEVVFVDDGSTDGTGERLDRLAAESPNMRVIHTPNSGWPGRPRNIGIEASRGEYVQFVDNDDELGDEALERLYDYAVLNNSDVVVGREVIQNAGWFVAPELFERDRPRATLAQDPLMTSLTAHKMVRRSFLLEFDIRFPESRDLFEDHAFVMNAYLSARVVSVLSSYTCYYWKRRFDGSNAGASTRDRGFSDALDVVERKTEPGRLRDLLLSHWYARKVLRQLHRSWALLPTGEAREIFDVQHALALERFPRGVDAYLPGILRVRSALLRAGDFERSRTLADALGGMRLRQALDSPETMDGELLLRISAALTYRGGEPVVLDLVGKRLHWRAPVDLGPHVPFEALDFTDDQGRSRLSVIARSRASNETLKLPGGSEPLPLGADGTRLVGAGHTARVTAETLIGGTSSRGEVWDLEVQLAACGWTPREPLRCPPGAGAEAPLGRALSSPRPIVLFVTAEGTVALDAAGEQGIPAVGAQNRLRRALRRVPGASTAVRAARRARGLSERRA